MPAVIVECVAAGSAPCTLLQCLTSMQQGDQLEMQILITDLLAAMQKPADKTATQKHNSATCCAATGAAAATAHAVTGGGAASCLQRINSSNQHS